MNAPSNSPLKNAIAGKDSNPVASFSRFLDGYKSQIQLALPKHLNADRMARLALTAFSSTPKLQECEPQSIVASIVTASQMGLEIGVNGQGYLVPYKSRGKFYCQFVPGWKGLVDLVSRAGRATVWTGAVFDGDQFDYAEGSEPFIRHKPGDETDPAKMIFAYAVGRVNGSQWPVIVVWSTRKVIRHRDQFNKVGDSHYSFSNLEMYARKVVLLQVLKYMPASVELSNAIAVADAAETGRSATISGDFVNVSSGVVVDNETGEITGGAGDEKKDPPTGNSGARPPADPPAQATGAQKSPDVPTYAQFAERLQAAKNLEDAAITLDEARSALPAEQLAELTALYQRRKAADDKSVDPRP